MNNRPLVSVIMPVFNCETFVAAAIESILNQKYNHWELLICDDGSTDSSLKVVKKFSDVRIRLFVNKTNIGSLQTRNLLLKEAKGDLITLQDADDYSLCERISKQVRAFQNNPEVMLCGTWARYVKATRSVKYKKPPVSWEEIKRKIRHKNCFCSASIMFRRTVLEHVEPYREYFQFIGNYDYDLTARIAERFPSINIPEYLYEVTVRPGSNSRHYKIDDPLKFESENVVKALIEERRLNGRDCLQMGDVQTLSRIEACALEPYRSDPWLIYDKILNFYIDLRHYRNIVRVILQGFLKNPFAVRPYRFLFYAAKRVLT